MGIINMPHKWFNIRTENFKRNHKYNLQEETRTVENHETISLPN